MKVSTYESGLRRRTVRASTDRLVPSGRHRIIPIVSSVEQVFYEESVRSLEGQSTSLDNLRGRAGTLLAVASLVTSFLGGQALAGPLLESGRQVSAPISGMSWIAIGAFVVLAALTLWMLLPRRGWRFGHSVQGLFDVADGLGATTAEAYRHLALQNDRNHDENQRRIGKLQLQFQVAVFALFIECVAWIIELTGLSIDEVPGI